MIPVALTIAGSDSSGGAGIQADLKTFAARSVYGVSVITALTAQNTQGVSAIYHVPPDMVRAQMAAIFDDIRVDAAKIGMVSESQIIVALAEELARRNLSHLVIDPVMVATSGARLLHEDAIGLLRERLIPLADVITPNLPEAAALLNTSLAQSEADQESQARALLALGPRAVLLKGGHGGGAESVDWLVTHDDNLRLAAPRIATRNTHGTGCTLSAALTAELAKGATLQAAARAAKDYVHAALAGADRLAVGHGHGPLDHFHFLSS